MYFFRNLASKLKYNLQPAIFSNISKRILNLPTFIKRFSHDATGTFETEADLLEYEEMSNISLGTIAGGQRIFIIQPYIKWGRRKRLNTTPQLQMSEAEALISTLPRWVVVDKKCVPLLSLGRNKLIGRGAIEELKQRIQSSNYVTGIFVSLNLLKLAQIEELQKEFNLPIFDRYSIVIHIFRLHAKTPEAKLQVALAEIPLIWKKFVEDHNDLHRINIKEWRKRILQTRQQNLKKELKKVQQQHYLVRRKRKLLDIPSVAIVGYTNAGKTSLIRALTGDTSLIPRNQLFATLDTTAHEGYLPSRLKILYMDTIGFIQDVPEGMLAPFIVTLEDALDSDVIIHIYDASHPDQLAQIDHVRSTLESLNRYNRPIIEIANKCDLIEKNTVPEEIIAISATKQIGVDLLRKRIENEILNSTGRRHIRMRVESGTEAFAWLYKELTVTNTEPDKDNPQYMFIDVIATETQLYKFKRFLRN
ncbi:putative GTP-binding protein 6 [Leptopilina heterotoma]|uniref:putative GTP-binding protein 6 n=1 Tax=Leptopilina heterotoma TaxID=63436 RepID=UPI001CA81E35|nr:putative GTP-binding protein 6 [Leptopilina heterotoma]